MVCYVISKMMKSKKLLIWYWGRKGGGAQYSKEIAKEFILMDKENTYLSFSKQSDIISDITDLTNQSLHIKTYTNKIDFLFHTLLVPFLIIHFIIYLKRNRIDTVYTTMVHPWTVFFIPFFKLFKIKHILTVHDATIHPGDNQFFNLINKVLFKNVDCIIVLSNFVKNEVVRNFNIDDGKILKSEHGILNYTMMSFGKKDFKKNELLRVVFFGRILEYKGLRYLIEAITILDKKCLNIRLEIYGSGAIDEYKENLMKVKNLRLENRWIKDNEIYKIFDHACLNVSPYIEASQSGVIPIALSCGIPSIVTDLGGLREQIDDKITGIVINPDNITLNLVNEIEKLYLDRNVCNEMSESAFKYAQKNLLWKKICKELKIKIDGC